MSRLRQISALGTERPLVFGRASSSSLSAALHELREKQIGARPDRLMFFSVLVLGLVSFVFYSRQGDIAGMQQWVMLALGCVVLFITGLVVLRRFFYQRLLAALAASGLRERLEVFWPDYDPFSAGGSRRAGVIPSAQASFAEALKHFSDNLWLIAEADALEPARPVLARLAMLERAFVPMVITGLLGLNVALFSGGQLNSMAFFSSIFLGVSICLLAPYFRYLAVYEYLREAWEM